ncbi:MAG: hypothetical protein P1U56_22065 [Saprospiraceae bacterium]|nr:hypothetical protein [Saprospiraceae bacterium]
MDPTIITGIIGAFGIVIGYFVNFFLEKYKARNSLKESLSNTKVEFFKGLWKISEGSNLEKAHKRYLKYHELMKWYNDGGGLLLSFEATERIMWAIKLLKISLKEIDISDKTLKKKDFKNSPLLEKNEVTIIKDQLSWLRSSVKEIVGAYSRQESSKSLSDIPGQSNTGRNTTKDNKGYYKNSRLIKEIKELKDLKAKEKEEEIKELEVANEELAIEELAIEEIKKEESILKDSKT